jgi:beta-N-acetylhexosaminidase
MAAAECAGGIGERIAAHRRAGCDLVLVCKPEIVAQALQVQAQEPPCDPARVASLQGFLAATWEALVENPQRTQFLERVGALNRDAEFAL